MTTVIAPAYKVGQTVHFTNGSDTVYKGKIVKVHPNGHTYLVLDTSNIAEETLWNLGYTVGSTINSSQIIKK